MLVKVAAFQGELGRPLTLDEKILIFKQQPDLLCLPEYFQLDDTVVDFARAALLRREHLDYLSRLSEELQTCVAGGTVVEAVGDKLYNVGYVIDRGREIGRFVKRYPVPNEQKRGISGGEHSSVIEHDGVRIGMLICGDVFYPHLYDELRADEADIIVIPTTSPFRSNDTAQAREKRDRVYFLDGARRSGALVIKTCGVGTLFGKPLQGRSLIAAPWSITRRIDPHNENQVRLLTDTVDLRDLRDFRSRLPVAEPPTDTDAIEPILPDD